MLWNIETTLFFLLFAVVIGVGIQLAFQAKAMFRKARELEEGTDTGNDLSRMS